MEASPYKKYLADVAAKKEREADRRAKRWDVLRAQRDRRMRRAVERERKFAAAEKRKYAQPKKRSARKKRKPLDVELANANAKWEEWETKRRLADTKTRYWRKRVVMLTKKVDAESKAKIEKLERATGLGRTRRVEFETEV